MEPPAAGHTRDLTPENHLAVELLELLTSLYLYRQPCPNSGDPLENLRTQHMLHILHNDIVIRLCKLSENNRKSWNFDQAHKVSKRAGAQLIKSQFLALQQQHREAMRPIEQYRNASVAHRQKCKQPYLKPIDLVHATSLAVRIVDILAGERLSYNFGNIDLRQELSVDVSNA